ncbi:threonine dehydratase [Silvibacterium bohemicum]|uniref:Threonine dehydratase n=1 Tax=Silvibacterium bohemicum TaxID=1577686 RepID=A0A841K3W0_9BACT|nr:threonine dehydratase [Silvibacterium bohemicum]MBB6146629.1 threonine dehydratase [Silvibacterium bohemicum]
MNLPELPELRRATALVRTVMPPTPTYTWPLLNARAGAEVWLKHENHSPVGAFKLRGAAVYIDWLAREQPSLTGVVAATRGNHGQGVALAARRKGWTTTIVVPFGNSREKNRAMLALGAELIEHGEDFQAANEYATDLARERGAHKVPSFHPLLVAGTGTYAMEMFEAASELDTVYVPIGMGSSICGVAAARAALGLKTKIVGVVAEASPSYALSFAAGKVVEHQAGTKIADGLACRVPVEDALGVIRKHVERIVQVSDEAIASAMRALYEDTHNVAEGAGAAAVAAILSEPEAVRGKRVGTVITGGNVDREVFLQALTTA